MISYIEGKIIARGANHVIVLTGGIGYKVFLTADGLEALGQREQAARQSTQQTASVPEIALWIHHVIREDAMDLYGFIDQETVRFFELLISISGIGPKTALSILNSASVKSLRSAVIAGDPQRLTKVSGIGKKNAEKIVLELKGKIIAENDEEGKETNDESDALEALKGLGYSERDAREALKKISKKDADKDGGASAGEKIKQALKILAK